jgi:4-diphosphocytidyl-2C-methyl-D-erythritol kinase
MAPKACEMLVLVPPFATATADAYRWLDEDRAAGLGPFPPVHAASASVTLEATTSTWRHFRMRMGNSFEPVLERRHPELRVLRERLDAAGAESAMLAGSGSCVFGVFLDRAPSPESLDVDAQVIATRTSDRVVEVEVLQ